MSYSSALSLALRVADDGIGSFLSPYTWIRLCPGLSKNSENGNSCPKPHKAARMIEAVGRAVSIETETIYHTWYCKKNKKMYKKIH